MEQSRRASPPTSVIKTTVVPDTSTVVMPKDVPKRRIVVSLLSDDQEFQILQAQDARTVGRRLGFEIELVFSNNNALTQIRQIFDRIRAPELPQPIAIVIEAGAADGLVRVARAAVEQGIGWVMVASHPPYLDELHKKFSSLPIASVIVDDEEIGTIQAQQFRALLPRGGGVLYVEGPSNNPATIARRTAMERGLAGSNIKIEKTLSADWSEAEAERVMSAWLKLTLSARLHPRLLGVQNDTMAMGVRKAIETYRPEWLKLPITGCDGLPNGGQYLVDSRSLTATVIKPSTMGAAIELVGNATRGEHIKAHVTAPAQSYPTLYELAQFAATRAQAK